MGFKGTAHKLGVGLLIFYQQDADHLFIHKIPPYCGQELTGEPLSC
jgi:hypothetical protein